MKQFIKTTIREFLLLEARFSDIEVLPSIGIQRGASDEKGRSFDIIIGNPDVVKQLQETPMGKGGTVQLFAGDGPNKGLNKEYKWNTDTKQLTVWKNINYIILTENNEVHWYNGKIPGGSFGVQKSSSGENGSNGTDIKTGQAYSSQSPNKPLSSLTVKEFGYKVYKALLLEPSVGFIKSSKHSTPEVKNAVYSKLMKDPDLKWVSFEGTGGLDYDSIVIINPKYADTEQVVKDFESEHQPFFYSANNKKIVKILDNVMNNKDVKDGKIFYSANLFK
jgi:hypothetical protein